MSMTDPGGDRRAWETEWQALEPELRDAPAEALPEVDALVADMMADRGFPAEEEETVEFADPEIVADFRQAREVTRRLDAGETVDPSDVGNAVEAYRRLYQYLLEQGPAAAR